MFQPRTRTLDNTARVKTTRTILRAQRQATCSIQAQLHLMPSLRLSCHWRWARTCRRHPKRTALTSMNSARGKRTLRHLRCVPICRTRLLPPLPPSSAEVAGVAVTAALLAVTVQMVRSRWNNQEERETSYVLRPLSLYPWRAGLVLLGPLQVTRYETST